MTRGRKQITLKLLGPGEVSLEELAGTNFVATDWRITQFLAGGTHKEPHSSHRRGCYARLLPRIILPPTSPSLGEGLAPSSLDSARKSSRVIGLSLHSRLSWQHPIHRTHRHAPAINES